MALGTLWILVSLQRSGTTWFMREMARSPCVRWEAAVFDKFDDKGPEVWSHAHRRAALEGLKRLVDRGEARFDAPGVSEHLERWTEHTAELMNNHNYTRAPVAVGMKWMGGFGTGGQTMKEARLGKAAHAPLTVVDNQGLEKAFDTWLIDFSKSLKIKFVFLERDALLRRLVSSFHNKAAPGEAHTSSPVWKSNFRRPTPSTRELTSLVDSITGWTRGNGRSSRTCGSSCPPASD